MKKASIAHAKRSAPAAAVFLLGALAVRTAGNRHLAWPHDGCLRALALGLANTLRVSTLAVALASVIGWIAGQARLSHVRAVAAAARAYVELFRNTPLLLQLLFWCALVQAWHVSSMSAESAVLLIALSVYAGAFVAEIVRSGMLAIDAGQTAAASALGLSAFQSLRYVTLPQAIQAALPDLVDSSLTFFKNTALVAVVGVFDVFGAARTVIGDPPRPGADVAVYLVVAAIYFMCSFSLSRFSRGFEPNHQ